MQVITLKKVPKKNNCNSESFYTPQIAMGAQSSSDENKMVYLNTTILENGLKIEYYSKPTKLCLQITLKRNS